MTAIKLGKKAAVPLGISLATLSSLAVRPARRLEESSEGHWLRVAHANGLADPTWLLADDQRRALSIVRVCPRCLARPNAYWPEPWNERSRPFCEKHGLWLVDQCGQCCRLLRWNRVRFLACRCGQDLRELAAAELSAQMTQAMEEGSAPLPVLLWLGSLTLHGLAKKPLKKASRRAQSEVVRLAEAGAEIVAAWPQSFFEVLDHCRLDVVDPRDLRALNHALPGLTKRISKLRDRLWRERIAEQLGSYANASLQSRLRIAGRNVLGPRPLTVAQIARELGMRSTNLAAALDRLSEAQVAVRMTPCGRRRRLVSSEAVRQVQEQRIDEISVKEAARLTGLSSSRVNQFIDAGLLEKRSSRMSREAVHEFSESLLASGKPHCPDADCIPLRWALRHCVPVSCTYQLIQSIIDGSLVIFVPRGATLVTEVLVSKACCQDWAARTKRPDCNELTIPECAETLRLKQEVVYHLARVGLLPVHTVKIGPRRTARVVGRDEVAQFKRRYESLARLATDAGVDHRSALSWASSVGLALVSGPLIDGGRQYFALRPVPLEAAP